MAKVKTIGNKAAILERKNERVLINREISKFSTLKEAEIGKWVDEFFSCLPEEAREGMERVVRGLWACIKKSSEIK